MSDSEIDVPLVAGLSLGSHFACISLPSADPDAPPSVIANEDGDRQIPACVAYTLHETDDAGSLELVEMVGTQADHQRLRNMKGSVVEFRDFIGLAWDDKAVQAAIGAQTASSGPNMCRTADGKVGYVLPNVGTDGTRVVSVNDITTTFFRHMDRTVRHYLAPRTPEGYCISHPAHFSADQRDALKRAAEKAGLFVMQLVSEPAAAVLAYHASTATDIRTMDRLECVVDLGARTLDCTTIAVRGGMYTVLGHKRFADVGGRALDEILSVYFAGEFRKKTGLEVSGDAKATEKLRQAAEIARKTLSRAVTAQCSVESLRHGRDLHASINRLRFETLAKPVLARCVEHVREALEAAGVHPGAVGDVVLVGGTARTPRLIRMLREDLFRAENTVIRAELEPDEATARGCAVQAQLLYSFIQENADREALNTESVPVRSFDAVMPEDISSAPHLVSAIGLMDAVGRFHAILRRDTPLPARRVLRAGRAAEDAADRVLVALWEGEEDVPELPAIPEEDDDENAEPKPIITAAPTKRIDRRQLCELVLTELPAGEEIEVEVAADATGKLKVAVRGVQSGRAVTVEVPGPSA